MSSKIMHNYLSVPNMIIYVKVVAVIALLFTLDITIKNGVKAQNTENCELSITISNQKRVCRNRVIFEDNFSEFDKSKWLKEQFIPSYSTANEIMVFNYFNESNVDVVDGRLTISPTIVDDQIVRGGHLKLEPCTGTIPDECDKKAQYQWILPPVASGRVSTKNSFAFKYGQVEITAKVPAGDWLVPEFWLLPKTSIYGPGIESGRISMIRIRGNKVLFLDGTDLSVRVLESSISMSSGGKTKSMFLRVKSKNEPWHIKTNKYAFTWRPDEMTVSVNGIIIGRISFRNLNGTLADFVGFPQKEARKWSRGSETAPFDQEFYISLGLSVGGSEFPDGIESGGYSKPWKSSSVKGMVDFWTAKDKWAPTWNKEYSKLKIVKVQVKSL